MTFFSLATFFSSCIFIITEMQFINSKEKTNTCFNISKGKGENIRKKRKNDEV